MSVEHYLGWPLVVHPSCIEPPDDPKFPLIYLSLNWTPEILKV